MYCVFLAQDSVRHVCSVFNSSHANSSASSLFSTDSCLVILVWLCSRQFNNFGTHERISVHVAFAWVCKIVLMVQYHVEHFNMTLNSGFYRFAKNLFYICYNHFENIRGHNVSFSLSQNKNIIKVFVNKTDSRFTIQILQTIFEQNMSSIKFPWKTKEKPNLNTRLNTKGEEDDHLKPFYGFCVFDVSSILSIYNNFS